MKRACSAVGSAPHSHCGGREFESPQVHQKSTVILIELRWAFSVQFPAHAGYHAKNKKILLTNGTSCCIITKLLLRQHEASKRMEKSRSWPSAHDWKSCIPQKGIEGSNPSFSAILTKRYRCVWRKARRINRFRAFSGLDSFFQTTDANRRFRASALIRTGRFPFSGRCIQPVPFLNGVFSDWQRCFSQKRITKIRAPFCWS